jgi:hypothetical protein
LNVGYVVITAELWTLFFGTLWTVLVFDLDVHAPRSPALVEHGGKHGVSELVLKPSMFGFGCLFFRTLLLKLLFLLTLAVCCIPLAAFRYAVVIIVVPARQRPPLVRYSTRQSAGAA